MYTSFCINNVYKHYKLPESNVVHSESVTINEAVVVKTEEISLDEIAESDKINADSTAEVLKGK